jgi:hypothetical protein
MLLSRSPHPGPLLEERPPPPPSPLLIPSPSHITGARTSPKPTCDQVPVPYAPARLRTYSAPQVGACVRCGTAYRLARARRSPPSKTHTAQARHHHHARHALAELQRPRSKRGVTRLERRRPTLPTFSRFDPPRVAQAVRPSTFSSSNGHGLGLG